MHIGLSQRNATCEPFFGNTSDTFDGLTASAQLSHRHSPRSNASLNAQGVNEIVELFSENG